MIYLDNSATTRVDEDVFDSMLPWLKDNYGNASSIYSLGRQARIAIEDARTEISALLNIHPAELIFTSGGTESNNAILKSVCGESALTTRLRYGATEHHSVIHPSEWLSEQGFDSKPLDVDSTGVLKLESLEELNSPETLVSVMTVNNETGVVHPIKTIRDLLPEALFHTDAVQALGKVDLNLDELGVDFASISAHKIHGPKGIGAMYIKRGIDFKAHQQGGGQERNRRAGTEAVALIVGFQSAVRKAVSGLTANNSHVNELRELATTLITEQIPDISVNSVGEDVVPHIINVSFRDAERLDGEAILQNMDMRGVAVSNGSACVSGSLQPSHVLQAMGRDLSESKAAVRFSFCKSSTVPDVREAVAILSDVIRNLRVATHN